MKRALPPLLLSLLLPALLAAQGTDPARKVVILRGYVVDAMCGRAMVGKAKAMRQAASHTRACALDKECSASGYGIFADGKWYEFDGEGDAAAQRMLAASVRTKGMLFEVTGSERGGTFIPASMREIDDRGETFQPPPAK